VVAIRHAAAVAKASSPLACFGAPLEYWFFKVNSGGVAFLVDFILRRRAGSAEVRISSSHGGTGQVARATAPASIADGSQVVIAGCSLTPTGSTGRVGDVAWDLALDAGPTYLDPRNALLRLLSPLDMALVSWPRARLSGSVTLGGQIFRVGPAPGLISHYWGHRLPPTWRWISANQFAGETIALEAMLLRTHLWGAPWPLLTAGYFFLERGGVRELIVSPHGGRIEIEERGAELTLSARRFGGQATRVRLSARPEQYNDLGDGIRQTLVGTCTLADGATADLTCGIEQR
jgi:hypothetical protein